MTFLNFPVSEQEAGGHGNLVIYSDVQLAPFLVDLEAVASQAWMIGRTYSASPQRDLAFTKGKDPSQCYQKILNGKGVLCPYPDFFHVYALNILLCSPKITDLNKNLRLLYNAKDFLFDFDLSNPSKQSQDSTTIKCAIACVIGFESISFDALTQMKNDPHLSKMVSFKKGRANPTRNYSFASKFIHFRAPRFVYILDSITERQLSRFVMKNRVSIDFTAVAKFLCPQSPQRYVIHFLKCYWLAKFYGLKSPREVDVFITKQKHTRHRKRTSKSVRKTQTSSAPVHKVVRHSKVS